MDLGRLTGKEPPIPSRRSVEGGVGERQPHPNPPLSSSNSGRGTPTRNEGSPPPQEADIKDQLEPTPPSLRTTSSQSRAPPTFSVSSTLSSTPLSQKYIPARLSKEQQSIPVPPAQLPGFPGQSEASQPTGASQPHQDQQDGQQTASDQPGAFGRQFTYTQQEDGQQDAADQHPEPPETMPQEINSQRSKSSSIVRPTPTNPLKYQTKQQGTTTTTNRPPWRAPSKICKLPSVNPLPSVPKATSAAASVRQHRSETQMSTHDYQMSAKQSQISAKQGQISARQSQGSAKQNQMSIRQSQGSAKPSSTKQSHHPNPADMNQPSQTRRNSQVSEFTTITPVVAPQDVPSVMQSLTRLPDDVQLFSPTRSDENVRVRGEDQVLEGAPARRSSERITVERATDEDQARTPVSRPTHFEDDHVRFNAEDIVCTIGPNRTDSERIQEECATIMQKLTAELALSRKFSPTDRLCVRVSLGEQLTSDGKKKSFTICEPRHPVPADQTQDDGTEIYATPMASSPRGSVQPEAYKPNESIREVSVKEASGRSATKEPEQPPKEKVGQFPSIEEVLSPKEVPLPPSIEEILPPPNEQDMPPRTQTIPTSAKKGLPSSPKPVPRLPAAGTSTVPPVANPTERRRESQEHLDRESSTGIKMKTMENEALNTEFLYYSSVLKNLLPVLSCPEDRCRLVPWVKKLFSPEYCARLLRDKRNRFLLHLALVLCNDEVIGVFRKPTPEGTIPSVDELCTTCYPPAAWECDSAWLDHLEDVPPGVARMPCSWHPSGCPAPADQPAAATHSNEGPTCPEICYPWRQFGTSHEVSFGWSLDQEFKLLLYLSRPLKPLMKVSRDRQRMVAWIRFLCTVTPDCCVALRTLRNDYAKLLLAYCQDDRMTGPFASDPVWGQPLPPLGGERDADQAQRFANPASGDVDEFLRSVSVPNEGAFCYVAVDGIPVTPITRPTASASLLQR